jgi:hypothetical protein
MAEATQAPPQLGTFCWNEVMTPDAAAAKRFYTKLFGWTTEDKDMGKFTYTIFKSGNTQAGGLMELKGPQAGAPPSWLAYVAVKSVDESTKKAQGLGAKVCVPPTDIPNIGRFSVITDPTGATLGLFQGK